MKITHEVHPKDTLEYLILETVSNLDEQNVHVNQIVQRGCPAVGAVARFLDSPGLKRLEWCQQVSRRILGIPFEVPNPQSPWQYSWKLDEALKRILRDNASCRRIILKKAIPGAAFRAAVVESHSSQDSALILKAWKRQGKEADSILWDLHGNTAHLKDPAALPLLIEVLESSPEKAHQAAETLILLTGRSAKSLVLEKLPPQISRVPKYVLKEDYLKEPGIMKGWQTWWSEVRGKIHWDDHAEFPVKMDRFSRPLRGKFVW